jgi:hypothetical protein
MNMENDGVYFTSSRFNIVEGEEDFTNPGCFGKELGTWLCDNLKLRGYPDAELLPEDFGWCVMCSSRPFMLWVGCGSVRTDELMNSSLLEPPQTDRIVWTAFAVAEMPFFYMRSHFFRLLGRIDMESVRQILQDELRAILESASDINFTVLPSDVIR